MERFDFLPFLKGSLVEVRPLVPGDSEGLFSVASDPLLWELHPQKDRYKKEVYEVFFEKALEPPGSCAVVEARSGEIIGSSRYYDFDPEKKQVCIGYTFIARKFWGSGHNRELKALMLDHAFRSVERVLFHIGENNFRSRRAVEKIGAVFVGEIMKTLQDGTPNPSVIYEITKTQF